MQADRKNEQINRNMQKSIKQNSQIAEYSLDQLIHNSNAVTRNVNDKQRMVSIASRRESSRSEASSDSRGISADSATAKAMKRSALQASGDQLSALSANLDDQLMQVNQRRKQQLSQRDTTMYAPVNFSASSAPVAQDNSFGIIAGGLLNMASIGANAGYFGA